MTYNGEVKSAISRIRSALKHESFTSGTCKVPVEHCELYYKSTSKDAKFLNLAKATNDELEELISACDAAPFGRGSETVLDESYRKALKLDLSQFSMPFELASTEILHKIQQDLVETDNVLRRRIRADPYTLNIYDKGAFFKPHQDTPRAENMFGSLVVIFPTPHDGGNFSLSSGDQKWFFDGSKMLSASTPDAPEVAYVAFYSDTTHEVLPVTSGCRITLTYNLYFETAADVPVASTSEKYEVVRSALKEVVDDPVAFPANGMLCFGLAHQYSVRRKASKAMRSYGPHCSMDEGPGAAYSLAELAGFLKGSDALIYKVCKDLGLNIAVKSFYTHEDYKDDYTEGEAKEVETKAHYIGSDFIEDTSNQFENTWDIYDSPGLRQIEEFRGGRGLEEKVSHLPVVWVTEMSARNRVRTAYATYGNYASIDFAYGDVCLVVEREQ